MIGTEQEQEDQWAYAMSVITSVIDTGHTTRQSMIAIHTAFVGQEFTETANLIATGFLEGRSAIRGIMQHRVSETYFQTWNNKNVDILDEVWESVLDGGYTSDTCALIGNGHVWGDLNLYLRKDPRKFEFYDWCQSIRINSILYYLLTHDDRSTDEEVEKHIVEMVSIWDGMTERMNLILRHHDMRV